MAFIQIPFRTVNGQRLRLRSLNGNIVCVCVDEVCFCVVGIINARARDETDGWRCVEHTRGDAGFHFCHHFGCRALLRVVVDVDVLWWSCVVQPFA